MTSNMVLTSSTLCRRPAGGAGDEGLEAAAGVAVEANNDHNIDT